MELPGFLKAIILVFVLIIPISIAYLAYRTLFSGLNSISSSKNPDITPNNSENPEQSQNQKQSEKGIDG
jgi:hypothetical protein